MALTWVVALVGLLAMIIGEAWRVAPPSRVRDAPLSQATALALAMSTAWPISEVAPHALPSVLGPLLLCAAAVLLVAAARRRPRHLVEDLLRLCSCALIAGLLVRIDAPFGRSLFEQIWEPEGSIALIALALLVVAVVAVSVPVMVRAARRGLQGRESVRSALFTDLGRHGPVALATASTAVVMALALTELGPASLMLFLVPLLVLQPAVARQRSIRLAQRQTMFALARLPEEAGLTAAGHSARVASLAVPVARELGVEGTDLSEVEAAALLHDIGQVGLLRPVPGGATVEVSGRDQRRIAGTGSAILARTAELSHLASLVADVGIPHHRAQQRGDVPVASRIVRVVSAYDDLTGRATRLVGGHSPVDAVERILRNTPHDFDPLVVVALIRQLERRGVLTPAQAAELRD